MAKDALETQLNVRNNCEELTNQFKQLRDWQKEIKEKEKIIKMKEPSTSNAPPIRNDLENFVDYENKIKRSKTTSDISNHQNHSGDSHILLDEAGQKLEADTYKEKGNTFVKLQDYDNAIHFYTKAIHTYAKEPIYHSNLALCYLRKERYTECIESCNEAISLNPDLSKAFYRRSQAYEMLGENHKAIENIMQVIQLEPNIVAHRQDLKRLESRLSNKNVERGLTRTLEKRVWLPLSKNQKYVDFIHKNPSYRSKKPMRQIKIDEVLPTSPASIKDSGEKIPDAVIDKLFNNNTGECTAEPLPSRHTLDFGAFYRRKVKSPPRTEINDDIDDDQLQPPSTGTEFWKVWKDLSTHKRFVYLKKLSDKPLNKILGASLDSETLTDIIRVLNDMFIKNNLPVDRILTELGQNGQTNILTMFFTSEEKKCVSKLVNYMKQNKIDAATVQSIQKQFNLI